MDAYFAGGCFWCLTPPFRSTEGVLIVESGYSGGDEINPTYLDVKSQKTGHRETIHLVYDETKVSYDELLDIYIHGVDPFDEGGQYIDRGFSYTLAIYYLDDNQKIKANEAIESLENKFGEKAYIAVERFKSFYKAEEYHQDYDLKNPQAFQNELIESGRVQY